MSDEHDRTGEGCGCPPAPLDEAAIRADERAKHGERIAAALEASAEEYRADDQGCESRFCAGFLTGLRSAANRARTTEATA